MSSAKLEALNLQLKRAAETAGGLHERAIAVTAIVSRYAPRGELLSPAGREVLHRRSPEETPRRLLMFGSNNYLGLADHPHIVESVRAALSRYGAACPTPPFRGKNPLHAALEERVAALKCTEDAVVFASGYSANVDLMTSLCRPKDTVVSDELIHRSVRDGLKLSGARSFFFPHNDVRDLAEQLDTVDRRGGDLFVCCEGIYSMEGDAAPLDAVTKVAREKSALVVLDEAHSTGVLGTKGRGAAEHFGVEGSVDIVMGTFSKALAGFGGFVASTRPITHYLRTMARANNYSTAIPPMQVAGALASLEVLEREPDRVSRLQQNVAYCAAKLKELGLEVRAPGAIVKVPIPAHVPGDWAKLLFYERGMLMAHYCYPVVPLGQERFRVGIMATHERKDIDMLVATVAEMYSPEFRTRVEQESLPADYVPL